jgi:hypothetical protein
MRIDIEQFFMWHEENMFTKSNNNLLMKYYLLLKKDRIIVKRVITCGYCKKVFRQERLIINQKYCSWGCGQAAAQLRHSTKRKNNLK